MNKIFLYLLVCVRSEPVQVMTAKGLVIGQKNEGYDTFFGVPYAKLNRYGSFTKPLRPNNFTSPFYANDPSVMCPQVIHEVGGTLECLCLNMYVPHSGHKRRPVLVWFPSHMDYGKAGDYGGQHLTKEGIIVIIVNFRLGIYGFGCVKEPDVPGNMALRDQIAALEWISRHIESFGGDPNAVTIGGQGYAGGFVDIHLYSDFEILFDKAILQSGSMFLNGFYGKPCLKTIVRIAQYMGIFSGSKVKSRDVLPALSRKNPLAVMNVSRHLNVQTCVCKEKYYEAGIKNLIKNGPFDLMKTDRIKMITIMIGYNSMEMLKEFPVNNSPEFYESLSNIFCSRLNETFHMENNLKWSLSKRMRKFYLGGRPIGPDTMLQLINFSSDILLNHPVELAVDKFMKAGATVYKYLFSYTGASKYKDIPNSGAPHGEELKYLFEMKETIEGAEQLRIRQELIKYWGNFIKFGDPTPNGEPLVWKPLFGEERPYLDINEKTEMHSEHVFQERIAFWDLLSYAYRKNYRIY